MNKLKSKIRHYSKRTLIEAQCPAEPLQLFIQWLDDAAQNEPFEANAMTLATVDKSGQPSARIVLLKEVQGNNFIYFTNYNSHKSHDLDQNPFAALVFWWPASERQVRIEGSVKKISRKQSEAYFNSRPRESKIGAIVSEQSHKILNRDVLDEKFKTLQQNFGKDQPIPCPAHWGGYSLEATKIEFWQGGPHRLHDRICYEKHNMNWTMYRLAP